MTVRNFKLKAKLFLLFAIIFFATVSLAAVPTHCPDLSMGAKKPFADVYWEAITGAPMKDQAYTFVGAHSTAFGGWVQCFYTPTLTLQAKFEIKSPMWQACFGQSYLECCKISLTVCSWQVK